ncbi:MAG: alanine racemase [Ruminococcaceae bacterium]|nr:alanine racemase [Oscillospiraceae bacterium]
MKNCLQKRTWMEIDLDMVEHNYNTIRNHVPSSAGVCCTIKADAYGHGAVRIGKLLDELGGDFFAVSNAEEAIQLRKAGIEKPIMVLGYSPLEITELLSEYKISQCIHSYEYGKALLEDAKFKGVKLAIHIKIDTGMGRIGFPFRDFDEDARIDEIVELCCDKTFITEGIFTHFPISDDQKKGENFTRAQYDKFVSVIDRLERRGITFAVKHCANSAGLIDYPEYSLDMVRAGVLFFGIIPSWEMKNPDFDLKHTFSWKTVVSHIKTVKSGESIGYSRTFIAEKTMKIATLPIGYADGFRRSNGNKELKIYVKDKPCSIVGRVCMDQIMIDVSDVEDLYVGDEITILGIGSPVSIYDYSELHETIPHEVMCNIAMRVPRIYYRHGKIDSISDYLLTE